MKKAFAECYRAVLACEDETGRKRCELFRDLPDKRVRNMRFLVRQTLICTAGLSRLLSINHSAHSPFPPPEAGDWELVQDSWSLPRRLEAHVPKRSNIQPGGFVGLHGC